MARRRILIGAGGAGVFLVAVGAVTAYRDDRPRLPANHSAGTSTTGPAPTSASASPQERPTVTGDVSSIVDGDTVEVSDAKGGLVRVRVLGIDTPETKDPRKPVQCWGPEASAFAERTLLDRQVALYTDPTQAVRDKYGRLLAYVVRIDDRTDYSVAAAAAGAARSYVYGGVPVREADAIAAAEQGARSAGLGLWGPPCNGGTGSASDTPSPSVAGKSATGAYFASCTAARAAGVTPLHRGEPGYRAKLDRDGDGVACE
jgi:micrococcal nuclease